jgi:DNA-binding NtrC family response regulator
LIPTERALSFLEINGLDALSYFGTIRVSEQDKARQIREAKRGDLPTQLQQKGLEERRVTAILSDGAVPAGKPEVKTLAELEREAILGAIRTFKGDKLGAAKVLGIGKTTLYRKLKEYGIADPLHEE